jgi:hypothetical protein
MRTENLAGPLFGALAWFAAYFLFNFRFWQAVAIAWFTACLFGVLAGILEAVRRHEDAS